MKSNMRKVAALLAISFALSASACSAESAPRANETSAPASASSAESTPGPAATPTMSGVPVHDQETDERDKFYQSGITWVSKQGMDSSERAVDPDGNAEIVAENLNWFLQRVTYEWTKTESSAYHSEAKMRQVFPESSEYISKDIPEYQSKKLFSAITNIVDIWRDVRFMTDIRAVEFSEDGRHARIPVEFIKADASPKDGLYNGLKDEHGDGNSGAILFIEESGDWKISGIEGYYGKYDCLWDCR